MPLTFQTRNLPWSPGKLKKQGVIKNPSAFKLYIGTNIFVCLKFDSNYTSPIFFFFLIWKIVFLENAVLTNGLGELALFPLVSVSSNLPPGSHLSPPLSLSDALPCSATWPRSFRQSGQPSLLASPLRLFLSLSISVPVSFFSVFCFPCHLFSSCVFP